MAETSGAGPIDERLMQRALADDKAGQNLVKARTIVDKLSETYFKGGGEQQPFVNNTIGSLVDMAVNGESCNYKQILTHYGKFMHNLGLMYEGYDHWGIKPTTKKAEVEDLVTEAVSLILTSNCQCKE